MEFSGGVVHTGLSVVGIPRLLAVLPGKSISIVLIERVKRTTLNRKKIDVIPEKRGNKRIAEKSAVFTGRLKLNQIR